MANHIDVIRYLNNKAKGLPKTAGNKYANVMNKLQSQANIGGRNVINAPEGKFARGFTLGNEGPTIYKNPKVVNQLIPYDANFANAQKIKQTMGNISKGAKALGYAGAGALGLIHYKKGQDYLKQAQQTNDQLLKKQLYDKYINEQRAAQLTLAPLVVGGAAKVGAMTAGKLAGLAEAKAMTPAFKQALMNSGINKLAIGAMENIPKAIGGATKFTEGALNKIANVAINPATMLLTQNTPFIYNKIFGSDNSNINNVNSTPPNDNFLEDKKNGALPNNNNLSNGYNANSSRVLQQTPIISNGTVDNNQQNVNVAQQPDANYNEDERALLYDYLARQEYAKPYRTGLRRYIDDYNNLSDLSYNQDKELALLAYLTDASGLNNMIGKYTALGDEEKKLGLEKVLANDIENSHNEYNRMLGNIAMAKKLGIPLNAINANMDLVKMVEDEKSNELEFNRRMALEEYKAQKALEKINLMHKQKKSLMQSRANGSSGRGGVKPTKGHYDIYTSLVEDKGLDPVAASKWVQSAYGVYIPPLPSGGLYGGTNKL